MMMISQVALIVNSLREKRPNAEMLAAKIRKVLKIERVLVFMTEKKGEAETLANKAVQDGFNCIIGMGGDGTLNEIINGIRPEVHQDILIGLIPVGTANDFFTSQFGKYNEERFLKSLKNECYMKLDIGKVTAGEKTRYFVNVADTGFGAFTTQLMDKQRRLWLGGTISYSLAIIRAFALYKKPVVNINSENFSYSGKLMMLVVCNGSSFGNGLIICPDATPDDGKLNFCCIGEISFLDYVKNYANLKKGIKIVHPEVRYAAGKSLTVIASEGNADCEVDGELFYGKEFKFSIVQHSLKFLDIG